MIGWNHFVIPNKAGFGSSHPPAISFAAKTVSYCRFQRIGVDVL